MSTFRAGASSDGDDTGIDECRRYCHEAIPPGLQALMQRLIQDALAADRAQRPEPTPPATTPSEPHTSGRINISGMDQLPGDVSLCDFLTWRQKWNDFSNLENLSRFTATDQMAALRMVMSLDMLRTMNRLLSSNPDTDKTTNAVLDAIQGHLRSRRSFYVDRMELYRCVQGPRESFDRFYIRLKGLAEAAQINPGAMDTELITGIICGIRNKEIKKKLLSMVPEPSLSETLTLCSGDEYANRISSRQSAAHMYKLTSKHRDKANHRDQPRTPAKPKDAQICGNCGFPSHPPGETCPAKGQTCNSCGKPNHFAPVCRKKTNPINRIGHIRPL